MSESPVGRWWPFFIDWFMRSSASWDDAWAMPTLRILCDMWPKGCELENRDEALARTARVPLKAWLKIREEMGSFWEVRGDKFVQPFLAEQYAESIEKAGKRSERASKGGQAKQARAQERLAEELAGRAATSSALSSASSTSPSTPEATLEAHTRAGNGFSSSSEEGREDLRATAVPKPEYVEACFREYPRERRGKLAANRTVAIPVDARKQIALFLLRNPQYPLLDVFRVIARTCDIPPAMADFLAAPWDAESTLRSSPSSRQDQETSAARDAREKREAEERSQREWEALDPAERARREAMMRRDFPSNSAKFGVG